MKISKYMPKDFLLLSGDDMQTVAMYAVGGKGVISVLANAYPQIFRKLKEYAFARDYAKASQQLFKLLEINAPMYEEGNPVGVKSLLESMGICSANVRLPLVRASKALETKISGMAAALKK